MLKKNILSALRGHYGRSRLYIYFVIFRVEIFHLKEEYRAIDDETCDLELDRFLHYVSII